MTFANFHLHMWETGCGITTMSLGEPIERVVIRTADGDSEVAAIHRDGNMLILDLGQPLDEAFCESHNRHKPCYRCQVDIVEQREEMK